MYGALITILIANNFAKFNPPPPADVYRNENDETYVNSDGEQYNN